MEKESVTVVSDAAVGEADVQTAPPKKRINKAKLQENLWGWAFVALLLIGTTVFVYISFIMSVMLSFSDYDNMSRGTTFWEALGTINRDGFFANYKIMFEEDIMGSGGQQAAVWGTLLTTVIYLIGIPIGMVLSLFFSVLMTRDIKFSGGFRVIYYIPTVSSTVSIALMWANLFGGGGLVENVFGISFIEGATAGWQRAAVLILTVWKGLGGTIVLLVAGLNGVNESHVEAADIDGANAWQIFWRIKMPQIYPTIFYVIVTSVIGGMQIYAEPALIFGDWGSTEAGKNVQVTPFVGYISGTYYADVHSAYSIPLCLTLPLIFLPPPPLRFPFDSKKEK